MSNNFGDQAFSTSNNRNIVSKQRDGVGGVAPMFSGSDYPSWVGSTGLPLSSAASQARRGARNQTVGYRLTRKLSTDSLLDYKTYQMEEPAVFGGALGLESSAQRLNDSRLSKAGAVRRVAAGGSVQYTHSGGGLHGGPGGLQYNHYSGMHGGVLPTSTMTLSRAQQHLLSRASSAGPAGSPGGPSGMVSSGGNGIQPPKASTAVPSFTTNASSSSRVRNLQLSRVPLMIQTETFQPFQPEPIGASSVDKAATGGDQLGGGVAGGVGIITGLMLAHIYCGHGLKSSRTALRDLYCVIDVDATNKARTMIRTGAINFDWDEEFDVELDDARRMSFLVYSWDPHTRHRLCFSAMLPLAGLVRRAAHHRLAIRLEPKGILYVELDYREPSVTFRRLPSALRNALFGVNLKELVQRERSGSNVPLLMQRCVGEVERRGLDQVGIYRLCGSARRKQQLREEFERNVLTADLTVEAVTDVNVITGRPIVFDDLVTDSCINGSVYVQIMRF